MMSNNNKYTTSVYDSLCYPQGQELTMLLFFFYFKLFNPSTNIFSQMNKTIKKNYKTSSPVNETIYICSEHCNKAHY